MDDDMTCLVVCPRCGGEGEVDIGGYWTGAGHRCEVCNGRGAIEEPVEAAGPERLDEQDEAEALAREECARRGIDPDELCADGGVEAWMVVLQEMKQ